MVGYIEESLSADEEVLYMAEFHWSYTLSAVIWLFVFTGIAAGIKIGGIELIQKVPFLQSVAEGVDLNLVLNVLAILFAFIGISQYLTKMAVKYSTELGVTSQRLVYKKGLFARHAESVKLDHIESTNVFQTIFGRLLGYGVINVRGSGIGEITSVPIAKPLEFRRALTDAGEDRIRQFGSRH